MFLLVNSKKDLILNINANKLYIIIVSFLSFIHTKLIFKHFNL
jgi:hypothetical protein